MLFFVDFSFILLVYVYFEWFVIVDWLLVYMGVLGLVIVEFDEDVLFYDVGYIFGVVKIDWYIDFNDLWVCDYINGE